MKNLFYKYRRFFIGLWHLGVIVLALVAAFLLRFDFAIPRAEASLLYRALGIAAVAKLLAFHTARLDRGWWRYVGMADLMRVLLANLGGSVAFVLAAAVAGIGAPIAVYFIDFLICFLGAAGGRFCVRLYYETIAGELSRPGRKGLLIYGAGMAGLTLLKEIRANGSLGYEVLGFLDDDPKKRHVTLLGVPVWGSGRDVPRIVDQRRRKSRRRVEEILIAMPAATGRQMQEALANCRAAGVPCKTVPGIGELLTGKVLSGQIRNVSINDLLGREPVRLEEGRIRSAIAGRSVLVTGAGGSIGSELCRQVAQFDPKVLVALDQAESDLFRIEHELKSRFPSLEIVAQIADIRDYRSVEETICRYAVSSIFHAAAYKHVPMMEAHALEAVRTNVMGTRNLVYAADRNGVSDFLMISSDKAVNPTNIMGVTKRVAELIVSSLAGSRTKFVAVRFGNVLGSNGSVVPLFQQQIAGGGPVTVTHPEVRRYFMTIREAVQLVLQASTMGKGSEIFVLDMGEPIRIADLARNMIRLSGREPDKDIEIRFIGLRPGEKLYEELLTEGEDVLPTYHEKVKIFQGPPVNGRWIEDSISELETLLIQRNETGVVEQLKSLVPEYQPWAPNKGRQPLPLAASR